MCEVTVCKGDGGRHARACSRVSWGEWNDVQYESRDTREFECKSCMETATATMARQMPGSGSSCYRDRPRSTRQRMGGPCRATDEIPACTAAKVRPGPETHAVDVADPADGQRPGWVVEFGTDGFFTWARV